MAAGAFLLLLISFVGCCGSVVQYPEGILAVYKGHALDLDVFLNTCSNS